MIRFVGEAARAAGGLLAAAKFFGCWAIPSRDPEVGRRLDATRIICARVAAEPTEFSVLWNSAAVPLELWLDRGAEIDQAERLATSLAVLLNERVAVRLGAEKTLIFFGEPR